MLSQAEWDAFAADFNTIIMEEYVRGSRRNVFAQARAETVSKQMQGFCRRVSQQSEVAHGLGLVYSTEATYKSKRQMRMRVVPLDELHSPVAPVVNRRVTLCRSKSRCFRSRRTLRPTNESNSEVSKLSDLECLWQTILC
jgi:hypothetical protein